MRRTSDLPLRDLRRVSAYLDGELTPQEANAFERSLREDANLAWALQEIRQTRKLLGSLPQRRAPRNFTLTPEMAGARVSRPAPLLRFATAVAMLAFTFTLGTDFLMNMAGGLAASAPAMEAVSDIAAKDTALTGALEEEAAPMAVFGEENAAGDQMDMLATPSMDEIPEMEMEEQAEAALLEEGAPEPLITTEDEIQVMEAPIAEDQAHETFAADEARSIEAPAPGGGNDVEEQAQDLTGEQLVLPDIEGSDAAGEEWISGEQENIEDQVPAEGWMPSSEADRGGLEYLMFWQRLSVLRILEIISGFAALVLGLIWLRQRKSRPW